MNKYLISNYSPLKGWFQPEVKFPTKEGEIPKLEKLALQKIKEVFTIDFQHYLQQEALLKDKDIKWVDPNQCPEGYLTSSYTGNETLLKKDYPLLQDLYSYAFFDQKKAIQQVKDEFLDWINKESILLLERSPDSMLLNNYQKALDKLFDFFKKLYKLGEIESLSHLLSYTQRGLIDRFFKFLEI
jgi:hypothetical protein